ncbi:MAG: hypothetical protein LBG73_10720 [Spirochaetaceae bacterium]|jgi:hypothetical protein|nr:hypothetical protein [Spirochaetaceae bacterium]
MKKLFLAQYASVAAGLALIAGLAGCPSDSGSTSGTDPNTENPGNPGGEWGEGGSLSAVTDTTKLNKNGVQVIHTMWGEPEEDPRQVIGYELADGTPYFDRYVMLYGFRLLDKNCSQDTEVTCTKTGLHIHIANDVKAHYLDQYNTYIKPVQDRGIKVLMSIVPQDSGVAVGSLYRWPMQAVYDWSPYPYGEAEVAVLIQQIAELFDQYPFDGLAYDEEYGNNKTGQRGPGGVYPTEGAYDAVMTNALRDDAWQIGGENLLRFAYEVEAAIGRDIIQEVYEIRYGEHVASEYTLADGTEIRLEDVIDCSYEVYYGSWDANSHIGMPRAKYGPASVSIADVSGGPKPPPGRINGGILTRMADHLRGNYGVVMYYCIRSRNEIQAKWSNYFGSGNPPMEDYFSQISQTIHGQDTVYRGPDYARVWE